MKFDRSDAVKTALQTYWQQGYNSVSVNGLCAQLGITRSSFYNAFGSLDALFDEIVDLYVSGAPWEELAQLPATPALQTPAGRIRAMYRLLCKVRAKDPEGKGCLLINTVGSLSSMSDPAREKLLTAMADSRAKIDALVRKAADAGELPPGSDPELVGDALHTLTIGLNGISRLYPSEERLWRLASATLDGLGLADPFARGESGAGVN